MGGRSAGQSSTGKGRKALGCPQYVIACATHGLFTPRGLSEGSIWKSLRIFMFAKTLFTGNAGEQTSLGVGGEGATPPLSLGGGIMGGGGSDPHQIFPSSWWR